MKCITNIVNNPKILTSEKLSYCFKFVWFKKFPYGFVISYLIGGWNFLSVFVLFSHEDGSPEFAENRIKHDSQL